MEMQVSGGERLEQLLREVLKLQEQARLLERQIYDLCKQGDLGSVIQDGTQLPTEVYEQVVAQSLRDRVVEHLRNLGISCKYKGYVYLKEGIAMLVERPEHKKSIQITKDVYPVLAQKFNATPARVERAIRTAIENDRFDSFRIENIARLSQRI